MGQIFIKAKERKIRMSITWVRCVRFTFRFVRRTSFAFFTKFTFENYWLLISYNYDIGLICDH